MNRLSGKRVLVTGGTGFIGGRLVEKLVLEEGADVRVLVRNFTKASRIARFPLTMVKGDATDTDTVIEAARDCDVLFHAAYAGGSYTGESIKQAAAGAHAVSEAARSASVDRLVHVSTVAVYGNKVEGDLDEEALRPKPKDPYARAKVEAERIITEAYKQKGVPISVVQPTIVYGPFGGTWTAEPLRLLKTSRIAMVDGGNSPCNAVYVDDVVNSLILAATKKAAVGETFLISGDAPVTWWDFLGAYEQMTGRPCLVPVSRENYQSLRNEERKAQTTINQVRNAIRKRPDLFHAVLALPALATTTNIMRKVIPARVWSRMSDAILAPTPAVPHAGPTQVGGVEERILRSPPPHIATLMDARTCVRIQKAQRLLGYSPRFGLKEGMEITHQWARWAGVV